MRDVKVLPLIHDKIAFKFEVPMLEPEGPIVKKLELQVKDLDLPEGPNTELIVPWL